MAVILKDMKMPESCLTCPLFRFYADIDGIFHTVCAYGNIEMCGDLNNERNDSCRLIEDNRMEEQKK